MAIGKILAARDFGLRVPYNLSVIGEDGHERGEVFGLTTIDQDPRGRVHWQSAVCLAAAFLPSWSVRHPRVRARKPSKPDSRRVASACRHNNRAGALPAVVQEPQASAPPIKRTNRSSTPGQPEA